MMMLSDARKRGEEHGANCAMCINFNDEICKEFWRVDDPLCVKCVEKREARDSGEENKWLW